MYSHLPPPDQALMRASIVPGWLFTAFSGVGGVWFAGKTVVAAVEPSWLVTAAALLTLVGGLMAAVGISVGRGLWWLEWLGGGVAGAGLVYYVLVPWSLLLDGDFARWQQAGAVSVALCFAVSRMVSCYVHARKLVRQHRADQLLQGADHG